MLSRWSSISKIPDVAVAVYFWAISAAFILSETNVKYRVRLLFVIEVLLARVRIIIWAIKYSWIRLRKKCATSKKFLCLSAFSTPWKNSFLMTMPTNQTHTLTFCYSYDCVYFYRVPMDWFVWENVTSVNGCQWQLFAHINWSDYRRLYCIHGESMASVKKGDGHQSKFFFNMPFRLLNGSYIFVFDRKAQKCPCHWHD